MAKESIALSEPSTAPQQRFIANLRRQSGIAEPQGRESMTKLEAGIIIEKLLLEREARKRLKRRKKS